MNKYKYLFVLPFWILSIMLCKLHTNTFLDEKESDYLYATLWYQRSQEVKATILSQYRLAALMLEKALQEKSWTAAPEEQGVNFENKPPAIILDIDETVLDNSPFVGWLIDKGIYYNDGLWNDWDRWILSANAKALPGIIDFVKYAKSKDVEVIYVSNRVASQEEATRKNLSAVGISLGGDLDTILLKNEKPDWRSKKGTRRRAIAEKYRVLLLVGDNFGDFVDHFDGTYQERDEIFNLKKYNSYWGQKWIVIPNPTYGSWEGAGYDFNSDFSRNQIRKLMKEKLIKWDGK